VHSIVAEQTLSPAGASVRASALVEVSLLARNIDQAQARTIIVGRSG
jgi:FMN-dependent NADH-azoreductase